MSINDWPVEERPRERLLKHGAPALSDAELVAIFVRTGVPGASAVQLARDALIAFGGVRPLTSAPAEALYARRGFGPAKFAELQAALELTRRALREEMQMGSPMTSPRAVRDYLTLTLGSRQHEVFAALFLDAQHRLIACDELFRGTLSQTSVYPREVVKTALRHNAGAVIFAHNHPSGLAEPSHADELLTQSLKAALALVDIKTLDHFIVAGNRTVSFAERGLL